MTTERPLGKIRMTRLRASGGGTAEPAGTGRHRRPANPDGTLPPAQIRADRGEPARDEA